jgi:hypothetical protein
MTVGCGTHEVIQPPGNLMAPPTIAGEVCVDTVPADAVVMVNDREVEPRCTTVDGYEGQEVKIDVSAPGYATSDQTVPLALKTELTVTLTPAEPPFPVGNLVVPPPVGNLMPPPPQPDPPKPQ